MRYTIIDGELYHWGVKGMRWGVRRKLRKMSDDDVKKEIARKKLENDYAQTLNANKQAAKQRKTQAKLEKIQNRTALVDAKRKQKEAEKLLKQANVKLSKKEQKKLEDMAKETQFTNAKASKLAAENRVKEERRKGEGVVKKLLSKLGWAAVDGVAEAGKGLVRDKLTQFGKDKLGLNEKDELSKLREEADILETRARIKRAKGEDEGENARLEAQRLENEEKIATKKKAAEERANENRQREAEEAALQRRLEELSKRSSDHMNKTSSSDITSGVDPVQKALKAAEARQRQEELRRKREETEKKKKK